MQFSKIQLTEDSFHFLTAIALGLIMFTKDNLTQLFDGLQFISMEGKREKE